MHVSVDRIYRREDNTKLTTVLVRIDSPGSEKMACKQRVVSRNLGGLLSSLRENQTQGNESRGLEPERFVMGMQKSETIIVVMKSGNADGAKGRRILNFQRMERHTCTETKKVSTRKSVG